MSKSFTHAGVSRLDGEMKVRFANDALRVKVLAKNGHKDIDIIELKNAMTKEDAVAYLLSIDFATQNGVTNADVQAALEAEVGKRADKPQGANKERKGNKEVKKPKKAPPAKPTMEAIQAKVAAKKAAPKSTVSKAEIEKQLADLEDAPF